MKITELKIFANLLLITLIISTLTSIYGMAQGPSGNNLQEKISKEVTIPGTELKTIHSEIMNQEMILFIKLPAAFKNDGTMLYPVWYWTDANRSFPMVANISGVLDFPRQDVSEMIIVSIGYPIGTMADWGAWRTRDLTPTNVPATDKYWSDLLGKMTGQQYEVKSGGAFRFLSFIIKEAIPFTEANYPVLKTDKGIGGYSYGGLFSLFTVFESPGTFQRCFAGSPSIGFDKGFLFRAEEKFASEHSDLSLKLFMSAGAAEDSAMTGNVLKMAEKLNSRKYPGLQVVTHIFPDENHTSCYPSAIMRAFKVLYKQ